jgi:hypothetical protein
VRQGGREMTPFNTEDAEGSQRPQRKAVRNLPVSPVNFAASSVDLCGPPCPLW